MDTCSQCGFTYGLLPRPELAPALGDLGRVIAAELTGLDAAARIRRAPDEWSALEYGCHVRDVLLMQRDRLFVALVEDEPSFKPMYREQRVAFDRYNEQPPDVVAAQLLMGAAMLAHAFTGLSEDQWGRPLLYGSPVPIPGDVEWVAHHTVHELTHHHGDIVRILGET